MLELFNESIQPVNLPATVLLGIVLLYWLMMILGLATVDLLDFDVDFDSDVDLDADVGGGLAADVLTFFHLGDVPVVILASFFSLFYWGTTLLSNHYFNPTWSVWVSLYGLLPCLFASLLLTKIITYPLVPLFQKMSVKEIKDLVGRTGQVSTSELNDRFGQISIEQDGPPIVVNARTENGQRLHKHDVVTITHFHSETGIYTVKPQKSENK